MDGILRAAVLLAAGLALAPGPARAGLPSVPVEQWRWVGSRDAPGHPYCTMSPVVAQLTDDDGDGDVDEDDLPDVAFLHADRATDNAPAVLTVVDGATGDVHFTLAADGLATPHLAAGDVDGDGVAELVSTDDVVVIVVEGDGTVSRVLPWPGPPPNPVTAPGIRPIGLADLDGDGVVELHRSVTAPRSPGSLFLDAGVTVLSLDGSSSWTVVDRELDPVVVFRPSQAADLDPSRPGLEVFDANALFDATGARAWVQRGVAAVGPTAVGDLDGDGSPELVVVATGYQLRPTTIHVLDALGRRVADLELPGLRAAGDVALADGDGDGLPEVVVPLPGSVRSHALSGGVLVERWRAPTQDESCCAGLTAFDFDGDGAAEIVYNDEVALHVLDGRSGASLFSAPMHSETIVEKPVVADIDADCVTEIVVSRGYDWVGPANDLVVAFEVPLSQPARPIWNQSGYHVTNVEDDGTIPLAEPAAWTVPGTWHAQVPVDCACRVLAAAGPPDVVACEGTAVTLTADGVRLACPGGVAHEWRDEAGAVLGRDATLTVTATRDAAIDLHVRCPGDAGCEFRGSTRLLVERAPSLEVTAAEVSPCNEGILVAWSAADWSSPAGGRYHVYRSVGPSPSQADALSRPPIARDLTALSLHDRDVVPGQPHLHVVQAEDAVPARACSPVGPSFAGAVGHAATVPVVAPEPDPFPAGVGAILRVRKGVGTVVATWAGVRPLLPGEHFHLLRAERSPTVPFSLANGEDDLSERHEEPVAGSRMHFFDLRVADRCERLSLDEFPPG